MIFDLAKPVITVLYVVSLLCLPTISEGLGEEKYIMQPVDHQRFSVSQPQWQQRYFVDTQYVVNPNDNTPIIFWVGLQASVTDPTVKIQQHLVSTLAETYEAYAVYSEHRYYGESLPFGNESFTSENLVHLTMDNAMIDYVNIISKVKEDLKTDGPVIANGCSYGAMLTNHFKYRFPQYVYGAVASAAHVLLDAPDTNWMNAVQEVYKTYSETSSPQCYGQIQSETKAIEASFVDSASVEALKESLNLCDVPDFEIGVYEVMTYLKVGFASISEFNYPEPVFLNVSYAVNETCAATADVGKLEYPITQRALSLFYNNSGDAECYDTSKLFKSPLALFGTPSWSFQTCTEVVMSAINGASDLFGNLTAYVPSEIASHCNATNGQLPSPEATAMKYPSTMEDLARSGMERVIHANGFYDPTRAFSVSESIPGVITVIDHPMGHCADLNPPTSEDSPGLIEAREKEIEAVGQWIESYNKQRGSDIAVRQWIDNQQQGSGKRSNLRRRS